MDYGSDGVHGKSKSLVIGLVLVGMAVLAAGAVVAVVKSGRARTGATGTALDDGQVRAWCELRQAWAQQVDALSADIALKSARRGDAEEKGPLVRRRDAICRDFGKKIEAMKIADPRLIDVEKALIKEGKVRANIAVEISNVLAKVPGDPAAEAAVVDVAQRIGTLRDGYDVLQERIGRRIRSGEARADQEVGAAMAKLSGCTGIYRGPMTDIGTSGSPYVSWKELDLERKQAAKLVQEHIRLLEPREQYANHVYHELVRKYGNTIKRCYARARRKNPRMSSKLRLQIRLSGSGKVQTLAIREMEVREEALVDCALETASRWRLPRPASNGEVVVLPIDLEAFR